MPLVILLNWKTEDERMAANLWKSNTILFYFSHLKKFRTSLLFRTLAGSAVLRAMEYSRQSADFRFIAAVADMKRPTTRCSATRSPSMKLLVTCSEPKCRPLKSPVTRLNQRFEFLNLIPKFLFCLVKIRKDRTVEKYSQTCVQQQPLGPEKSGRLTEVFDKTEI